MGSRSSIRMAILSSGSLIVFRLSGYLMLFTLTLPIRRSRMDTILFVMSGQTA